MYVELDGQGPRYAQLIRALKTAILDGRLRAAERVPASRVLALDLGISRNTVLAAYAQLQEEGFLIGRVGSGSYVAELVPPGGLADTPLLHLPAPLSPFAERALQITANVIPDSSARQAVRYDLHYGSPLSTPELALAWRRAVGRAAEQATLTYPEAQGLFALREQICSYLAQRRGVSAEPDEILIVSGTQQALALASRVLLDSGDSVVLEDPHYRGAQQVFATHGARVRACRVDADGLVPAGLPRQARLAVVTPSHQFPTGAVLPLGRRMELLDWARRCEAWLIEDDYDGAFRFGGRPLAALKSLDRDGRVIHIGSFSKILFPALRLGYMVLPPALRRAFVAARWLEDRGCNALEQAALARLMADGGLESHVRRATQILRERRNAMLAGLRRHAGSALEVLDSNAGLHMSAWLRHGSHADCERLLQCARQHGIGMDAVTPYSRQLNARPGILLGYAALKPVEIEAALALLGQCLDEVGLRSSGQAQ